MAMFEGGLIAALTMAFGIAPGRRFMPRSVEYRPLALARIEPVLDVSDVCPDVADAKPDKSIDMSVRPVEVPTRLASTRAFVKWWRTLPDVPGEVSQRYLCALYAEYCEHENVVPLSDRQLVNKIKQHGVEAFRKPAKIVGGKQHRPTAYRLRRRT
ncbi:MAG: hypothetical protein IPK82_23685 [Polyangiaceae bacterium]|nr:hypothetical protein [Polyangiaceae bacterium]